MPELGMHMLQRLGGYQTVEGSLHSGAALHSEAVPVLQAVLRQTADQYKDKLEWELYQARSQQAAETSTADFLRSSQLADLHDKVKQLQHAGPSTVLPSTVPAAAYYHHTS
jgi:dihydroxyacid dehydratase/phosphogluconate dehydratase